MHQVQRGRRKNPPATYANLQLLILCSHPLWALPSRLLRYTTRVRVLRPPLHSLSKCRPARRMSALTHQQSEKSAPYLTSSSSSATRDHSSSSASSPRDRPRSDSDGSVFTLDANRFSTATRVRCTSRTFCTTSDSVRRITASSRRIPSTYTRIRPSRMQISCRARGISCSRPKHGRNAPSGRGAGGGFPSDGPSVTSGMALGASGMRHVRSSSSSGSALGFCGGRGLAGLPFGFL